MAITRHPNNNKAAAQFRGDRGEDAMAAWYLERGFRILDRNWKCREGELDIVAANDQVVVFCEVKARLNERFADAAQAVDFRKQAKLRRAALRWLEDKHLAQHLRFDVATVISGRIRVIENAF